MGGADKYTVMALHILQCFIDLVQLVGALRIAPSYKKYALYFHLIGTLQTP